MSSKIHTDPTRSTSLGYAQLSHYFLECALAADDVVGRKPGFEIVAPIPVMYLVGHSVELTFKAYHLHKGVPLEALINPGHNLCRCLWKAEELGLRKLVKLKQSDLKVLCVLNELYSTKQLEYSVGGPKDYPIMGPLESLAKKLLMFVGPEVGYEDPVFQDWKFNLDLADD